MRIIVVGGGIGGLAAALALAQRGAQVIVLERAEAITEVGAGLQISPNGLRVIEALGLADELALRSVRARAVSLRNGTSGAEVARLDLKRLPDDQRYLFVHRADLIDILADAARAAGVEVRLLQKVDRIDGATVRLTTGDHVTGDLIVGADGLRSRLRAALNGAKEPFFTGQMAWRAVVPNVSHHPAHARVHMGARRHLVSYPLRGGKTVNLVGVTERAEWTQEGWHHADDPVNFQRAFADFDAEAHLLLNAVTSVFLWGLFRHPVAARWQDGRGQVALLGDAAHPTLPFLAQGANMALEDAWVLAARLAAHDRPTSALMDYEQTRKPRVSRVIAAANGNAWKYHLRPGPVRFAAHGVMRALSRFAPDRLLGQYEWLYGHDVTRER